ncbi:hypothetical protein [Chenggangzhangella methanolivorans]|uniref:Uncharacterized protein n=1 Tax=Chenggangzhangella methanolivorans TaxID=1437009 RepID=A0A9E6UG97_9HYPH|nr:hypothetical protein [Chenggangzhangella methanolivorans]QZN98517.1 hypothetical protein K6K41_15835 [Chenggangzhangella methanolivorans]
MSLVVENPVLAKEVGELAAGDVCLVRFSGETLVAFAAALPSGELKMVRFAGSKEKAPLKMSGWDDANSVEVMCLPDVVIRPTSTAWCRITRATTRSAGWSSRLPV